MDKINRPSSIVLTLEVLMIGTLNIFTVAFLTTETEMLHFLEHVCRPDGILCKMQGVPWTGYSLLQVDSGVS